MGKSFYFLLILSIVLIIVTFQNSISVNLKFITWSTGNLPIGLVLLTCLVAGYLCAYLPLSLKLWFIKRRLSRLREELPDPIPEEEEQHDESAIDEDIAIEGDTRSGFFKD